MPEERNCQCESNRNCGLFNGLFGGCGCNSDNDNTILFFIIVFLLLFTNFGCCNR